MTKKMQLSIVSMIAMVGVAVGAVSTPFTDSFESGSVSSDWATNGTGAVTINSSDAPAGGGNASCVISNDSIKATVSSVNDVWAQVYAKAAGYDGDPADTQIDGLSAVFFITKDGHLRVMDGDGANGGTWTNVASGITLTGNKTDWLGFVLHIDYVNHKWDIYQQTAGEAGNATLTRLAANLGFRSNVVNMSEVEFTSELQAQVDAIGLIQGYTSAGKAPFSTVKSVTVDHESDKWIAKTVGDISSYSSTESNLDNEAGWDLMMGMSNSDQIRLFLSSGSPAGYNTYDFNNGAWQASGGAQAPGGIALSKGDSWWVKYGSDSTSNLEFVAEGFNALQEDPPDMTGEDIVLVGDTGSGNAVAGWSHVVYGGSTVNINSSGLQNLHADDRIFVASPTGYFSSYYVGTDGKIYDFNGNLANLNLQSGYQVWVRNLAGDITWTIQ